MSMISLTDIVLHQVKTHDTIQEGLAFGMAQWSSKGIHQHSLH